MGKRAQGPRVQQSTGTYSHPMVRLVASRESRGSQPRPEADQPSGSGDGVWKHFLPGPRMPGQYPMVQGTQTSMRMYTLLLLAAAYHGRASAFLKPHSSLFCAPQLSTSISRESKFPEQLSLLSSLDDIENNDIYQNEMINLGNNLILRAALSCGATEPMLSIDWKPGRVIVTVDINRDENYQNDDEPMLLKKGDHLNNDSRENDIYRDEEDRVNEEEEEEEKGDFLEGGPEEESNNSNNSNKIDLSLIARAINEILSQDGEDSPAFEIAKLHEIEVTTPEFDNILRESLFEIYKGFDVIMEHWVEQKTKKKNKTKAQKEPTAEIDAKAVEVAAPKPKLETTEGKLVCRDYEKGVTILNVKGRFVKVKNDVIECVRLPKAKREKGAK